MTLELILNELSLNHIAENIHEASLRMEGFIETIRQATQRRASRALRTDRNLIDIQLAPDYPVRKWLNDATVDRETKRFFLTLVSKTPYLNGLPQVQNQAYGLDCWHEQKRAEGLLIAYLNQWSGREHALGAREGCAICHSLVRASGGE